MKACVVSLLLFGQSKSLAARKVVNLVGQIYFDRMTGPPLLNYMYEQQFLAYSNMCYQLWGHVEYRVVFFVSERTPKNVLKIG